MLHDPVPSGARGMVPRMHTLLTLQSGVLSTSLENAEPGVDRGLWRSAIQPAISMLSALGGGGFVVFHRPRDLTL